LGCDVLLGWQDSYISNIIYKHNTLGQIYLVLGLRLTFISRSVHALLQASLYSGYDCAILVNTQTYKHTNRRLLTGYTISSASSAKNEYEPIKRQNWVLPALSSNGSRWPFVMSVSAAVYYVKFLDESLYTRDLYNNNNNIVKISY